MFLTTRRARLWRWVGVAGLVLLVASYLPYAVGDGPVRGGSDLGLVYGLAAAALVVILALLGWRKRAYRSKLGTLEGWLQAHVVLGFLVLPLALFHAGFRASDRVAFAALVALGVVWLSGLFGTVLYSVLPRLLTEVQSNRSVDEIAGELNRLTASMARLSSGRSRAFEGVYRELVGTSVPGQAAGWKLLLNRLPGRLGSGSGQDARDQSWRRQLAQVPPEEQDPLRQLLTLGRQHRELHLRLAYQERYKNLLDAWLWIHVPATVVTLVLVAAHAVAAVYFGALSDWLGGWGGGG